MEMIEYLEKNEASNKNCFKTKVGFEKDLANKSQTSYICLYVGISEYKLRLVLVCCKILFYNK